MAIAGGVRVAAAVGAVRRRIIFGTTFMGSKGRFVSLGGLSAKQ
jgi:hypothetical protein